MSEAISKETDVTVARRAQQDKNKIDRHTVIWVYMRESRRLLVAVAAFLTALAGLLAVVLDQVLS